MSATLAPPGFRTGFVAIVGRPNVGKSTLLNALIGQKISITADKAQTTRHRIRGIRTEADAQYVFVDTPGYQTERGGALNRAMNRAVIAALGEVDCVVFAVEAGRWTPADERVWKQMPPGMPVVLALTKTDLAGAQSSLLPFVARLTHERTFSAVVPVSATKGRGLDGLLAEVRTHLPEAPALFDAEDVTDRSARFLASEAIREKLFRLVGDEIPYRSTVSIDRYDEEERVHRIYATIMVDADNHKAIVIGAQGERIKRIASEARADLERLLDVKVYLEVWVKARSGWSDSDAAVRAAGYE